MLGIAALVLATALAVIAVLLARDDDPTRVTPLREETTKLPERGSKYREGPVPGIAWAAKPRQGAAAASSSGKRPRNRDGAGTGGHPAAREGRPTAKRHDDEGKQPRRARTPDGRPPRSPAAPPAPVAPAPAPVSIPAGDAPPGATSPAPAPSPITQPDSEPADDAEPGPAPKAQAPEIVIEIAGGKLASKLRDVRPQGGHVRLRVRSDELVIVEVEGLHLSQLVMGGRETLIELDSLSSKKYEVELRRRKGVLLLLLERD